MPKDPPYYARITFRVTVTKFLRTSETVQADYDYAYGQEAFRHYGTFRMPDGLGQGSLEGLLHGTESMERSGLARWLEWITPKDVVEQPSSVRSGPSISTD